MTNSEEENEQNVRNFWILVSHFCERLNKFGCQGQAELFTYIVIKITRDQSEKFED